MGITDEKVKTAIGNIGCRDDGKVYVQIHMNYRDDPAMLTVLMTNEKAVEVYKTIKKAAGQGRAWFETGVPPAG